MILIIGLGNPGEKYSDTRHNIGFKIVEQFAEKNDFSHFKLSKKFKSEISEGSFKEKKVMLAKPLTFMNLSGKSIKSMIDFFKKENCETIVIHDEIDLPLGKIKISKNRGAAGHKGIESILKELKTKDFIRLRIGISGIKKNKKQTESFVLERFKKEEKIVADAMVKKSIEAIETVIEKGLGKAMTVYNK